ncbi:MAG: non-canonical purine NTP pyrophosphatase [Nanoarchaeota archaeon]
MSLYYATTNFGKFQSLQKEFDKYNVNLYHAVLSIPEIRSDYVDDVAKEKVIRAYKIVKQPVVVNDAGLYINSLKGFPKAYVSFALETIGLEGILKLVEGKDRTCEFRHCLAYKDSSLIEPVTFVSHVQGKLADSIRGEMQPHLWSKLGLIFIPNGVNKTLAEMSEKEYLSWSAHADGTKESRMFADWIIHNYDQVY